MSASLRSGHARIDHQMFASEQSAATANPWGRATRPPSLPGEAALWVAIEHRLIEGIHIGGALPQPHRGGPPPGGEKKSARAHTEGGGPPARQHTRPRVRPSR